MTQTVQRLWKGEEVPTSWFDAMLIPFYKRKGARKDWKNWRGIVLLNIASKIHALLLNRALRDLSDRLVPETLVGFRLEHGSADGLLVVRRVLECFRSMTGNDSGVFLLFVDLKKSVRCGGQKSIMVPLGKEMRCSKECCHCNSEIT